VVVKVVVVVVAAVAVVVAAAAAVVVVVVLVVVVVVLLDNHRIQFTGFADLSVKFSQLSTVFILWMKNCLALDL